jgi:hypothetical protein
LKAHPNVEVPPALLSAICHDDDVSVRVAASFLVMLAGREPVGSSARRILLRAADPLLEALQPRAAGPGRVVGRYGRAVDQGGGH